MTESSLVIVDTNVLLDVTEQDEKWADWSQAQMARHSTRLHMEETIKSVD